ncbi:hypothetical protein X798_07235 [Onchocerca flexuosa]|uniref:Uncharacterized protein n=1 Tax=Onchocerca flexuosa TaxID=387005 RepID=A0A238BMA1_9BILA|nr:hypothetical protein X798_07235 [Onchocerca flexuosa]
MLNVIRYIMLDALVGTEAKELSGKTESIVIKCERQPSSVMLKKTSKYKVDLFPSRKYHFVKFEDNIGQRFVI